MTVFLLVTAAVFVLLLATTVYYLWRRARMSTKNWDELVARLIAVDREGVAAVALDAIKPSGERRLDELAREMTPKQIWERLGGLDGVEALEKNSHVLVEMAMHLQKWYPREAAVAEELRLHAKELAWHVEKLRLAANKGHLEFHFASYAQNATIDYYLMTQSLLALCRKNTFPMHAGIDEVL